MKTQTENLNDLAEAFCGTDTAAIKQDVARLGSVLAASVYCAELAAEQADYAALNSAAGRTALRAAISAIIRGN